MSNFPIINQSNKDNNYSLEENKLSLNTNKTISKAITIAKHTLSALGVLGGVVCLSLGFLAPPLYIAGGILLTIGLIATGLSILKPTKKSITSSSMLKPLVSKNETLHDPIIKDPIKYIESRLSSILKDRYDIHNKCQVIDINHQFLTIQFPGEQNTFYKISRLPRNSKSTEANPQILNLYNSNAKSQQICSDYNLNLLHTPNTVKLVALQDLNTPENYIYDILIEESPNFSINSFDQQKIYHSQRDHLEALFSQLTTFICKSGCSSIDINNIPIDPITGDNIHLLNLEIPDNVTEENILEGLFGIISGKGLIHCAPSRTLVNCIIQTAKDLGVDVQLNHIQSMISDRLNHLNVQRNIDNLYKNPPKATSVINVKNIDIQSIEKHHLITKEDNKFIQDNFTDILNAHANNRSISFNDGITLYPPFKAKNAIFSVERCPGVLFKIFDSSGTEYPNVMNTLALNAYKLNACARKVIKDQNLDNILVPKSELLEIEVNGQIYNILALEKIDLDDASNINMSNYIGNKITKSALQLVSLNAALGLNLDRDNISILTNQQDSQGNYKVALFSPKLDNPINGSFGTSDNNIEIDGNYGIMSLANSENDLDEIILQSAYLGILDKKRASENKSARLNELSKYEDINTFYRKYLRNKQDALININPDDLIDYLDLDAVALTTNIGYFGDKNIISMKEAVQDVVEELNRFLLARLSSTDDNIPLAYRRLISLNLRKSTVLSAYNNVFTSGDISLEPSSWLEKIIQALVAKNIAYPNEMDYINHSFLKIHL